MMAITILEVLQDQEPKGSGIKNESLRLIRNLVRKHAAEIEEARSRGYSWKQIDEACRQAWQGSGGMASGILWWKSAHLVEDCYRDMKRRATPNSGKKAGKSKKKPLSLEVTVTER